jgi:hypothetical protein
MGYLNISHMVNDNNLYYFFYLKKKLIDEI